MAHEALRELFFHLSRDPANQVVVVEKPLGGFQKLGVDRRGGRKVLLDALQAARNRSRFEKMGREPPGPREIALPLGQGARIRFEGDGIRAALDRRGVCTGRHALSDA